MSEPMRLQKYLARAGVASRRASEQLITRGSVQVNGQVVTELGTKVEPGRDEVRVDGTLACLPVDAPVTLMLNKPAGYLTSMSDPFGRPCVASLVPCGSYPGLYPVGRLDRDTTGLLLFTTDGRLGNELLHPSRHVDKTYEALVRGIPVAAQLQSLREGIQLDDGPTAPARVREIGHVGADALLEIVIHEGRKRQVKRMCAAIGHPVLRLHRKAFGPLTLGDLPQGRWRLVEAGELSFV